MQKDDIVSLIQLLLAPVVVILLGLLLVISPDIASVFLAKLLSWILVALGIGFGIAALLSQRKAGKLILALALLASGTALGRNPLMLAAFAGRVVGLLLVMDGIGDIVTARGRGVRAVMPVCVSVIGAVLVLMPMTASRLVFSLCGLAALVIGIVMLLDRLRGPRLPGGRDKPDIIDAV